MSFRMSLLVYMLAIVPHLCAAVEPSHSESETVTIPLGEIWALNMSGTKDIRAIAAEPSELNHDKFSQTLLNEVSIALNYLPGSEGLSAKAGFVVSGTSADALRQLHSILTAQKERSNIWPADSQLWIIFFAHASGRYVHIEPVTVHDRTVEVRYQFVPHKTQELTPQIAMIPLGKLEPGHYEFTYVAIPLGRKYVDAGFKPVTDEDIRRIICKPFTFQISVAVHQ